MNRTVQLPIDRLSQFCRKWRIRELSIFGSAVRDDFNNASDLDFLVTYEPGFKPGWPAVLDLREELVAIVGREVDLVERRLLERSPNYIKRDEILKSAESVYAQE